MRERIPLAPIQRVVEEALARQTLAYDDCPGWANRRTAMGPIMQLAEEIAVYAGRNPDSIARLLWRIRTGKERGRGKVYEVKSVTFETADMILCALDREYLWYSDPELRDAYEGM